MVVSEVQEGEHPSRSYGLLYGADGSVDAFFGEEVDPARALPVRVHLPDGLGWIVADYGASLQYRASSADDWLPAGTNAAHLPADATAVRVTVDGQSTTVELQR